jgi:DNA-directed RNA polymerase subunit M/transcription elongation factor TFIIS
MPPPAVPKFDLRPVHILELAPSHMSSIKFCPVCRNYLALRASRDASSEEMKEADTHVNTLRRFCNNCGYTETADHGGLIMEMNLQETTSDGYKILLNEFTRYDPTLPHVQNIKCPNEVCKSNTGEKQRDVIYMKYDPTNLKYLYICNVCNEHWRSRS